MKTGDFMIVMINNNRSYYSRGRKNALTRSHLRNYGHFVPNHFVPSFGHFVPYRSKIIKTLSNRGLFEFKLNEIVMTMIKVKGKKSDDVVMTKRGHASA